MEIKKTEAIFKLKELGNVDSITHVSAITNTHSWAHLRYITNHPETVPK
jgi:hypothetical protein